MCCVQFLHSYKIQVWLSNRISDVRAGLQGSGRVNTQHVSGPLLYGSVQIVSYINLFSVLVFVAY